MDFKKYTPLLILLAAVLAGAGIYFMWIPKLNEFLESEKTVEARSNDFELKSDYLSKIESSLNALSDYTDEFLKINTAAPIYDYSEVALLAYVQRTASENGVILSGIAIVLEKGGISAENSLASGGSWALREMVLNASVSGSYQSFKNFIKSIYLNSRMIDIKSIAFGASEKGIFNFDLELGAKYYVWEKTQANPSFQLE